MQPGAENKLRQSEIGLPQIVLSFCIISLSETEPHVAGEIDDTEGRSRNAADVMGEAVEWVVGDWKGDSEEEMTKQRNDNTDR